MKRLLTLRTGFAAALVPGLALSALLSRPFTSRAQAQVVTVPSNSNIYGAGHTGAASTPSPSGSSPGPGPSGGVTPTTVSISGLSSLFISATGIINFEGGNSDAGPDGNAVSSFTFSSYNGISGFQANHTEALLGVFTGAVEPSDPAPASPDFVDNISSAAVTPVLDQIFFIGDGLTGTGTGSQQTFVVPTGATTLSLGLADGYPTGPGGSYQPGGYNDNVGSFQAIVSSAAAPEPGSLSLLLIPGSAILLRINRRSRRR